MCTAATRRAITCKQSVLPNGDARPIAEAVGMRAELVDDEGGEGPRARSRACWGACFSFDSARRSRNAAMFVGLTVALACLGVIVFLGDPGDA